VSHRGENFLLLLPGMALLAFAFLLPVGAMLVLAFSTETGFGVEHFTRFFGQGFYVAILWRTIKLSLLITLVCALIGFPLAYIMARSGSRMRTWLSILLILPLMTSVVIRSFGWMVLLNRSGPIVGLLRDLGLVGRNFNLMQSETAIVIAMVQVLLPFMTLSVLGVMIRLDIKFEEAGRTMGCSFLGVLLHIVLPLCSPGLLAGSLLTFTLSASSFVTPSLLGGARVQVLATSIYNSVTQTLDWSFASAQAVILFAGIAFLLVFYLRLSRQGDVR